MSDRRCPTCNTWKDQDLFRVISMNKMARDCVECEDARLLRASIKRPAPELQTVYREPPKRVPAPHLDHLPALERHCPEIRTRRIERTREFPGVDIDAIYRLPRYRHLVKR